MSTNTPAIQIGRWYLRWDKGEIFQVTGRDGASGTIRIRTFDGGSDEIPASRWESLPPRQGDLDQARAEPAFTRNGANSSVEKYRSMRSGNTVTIDSGSAQRC